MPTRRTFLAAVGATCAVAAVPGCASPPVTSLPMKTTTPRTACVLWYSQTGNTRRVGRAVAQGLGAAGLEVESGDFREVEPSAVAAADLLVLGTPVFYADVPDNLRLWLEALPDLGGTPVGAFTTFGGPGDGQVYTAAHLLRLAAARGGVPVGMDTFGCMSAFAPTWSLGNEARTLTYRDRPGADTFEAARAFARRLVQQVGTGLPIAVHTRFGADSLMRAVPQVALNKLLISNHGVDAARCIGCDICVRTCPTGVFDRRVGSVDRDRCLACLGCLNNCPVGAVTMSYAGRPLVGLRQFRERNGIALLDDRVVFLEGRVEETLPQEPAGPLALLLLDVNSRAATSVALRALHPRLSPGAFVMVEDYHLGLGSRRAVDAYLAESGRVASVQPSGSQAGWWRTG